MIRPADWPLLGLQPVARPSRTRKFIIDFVDGAWRVQAPGAGMALFPGQEDAVRFACERARETADRGAVALVVVKAELHELHCFTPRGEPQL